MGTKPDQPLDSYQAGELKTAFNELSANRKIPNDPGKDCPQKLKKAQLGILEMENREIQAFLIDSSDGEGHSVQIGAGSRGRKEDIRGKIEKRKWQKFVNYLLLRQVIENALERVLEIIKFHQAQMETLAELVREARSKLTGLDEQKQALTNELNRFRETGRFDLDETGKFKNAKAKEALSAWEEKTGSQIDLRSPSSYLGVMEVVSGIEVQAAEIEVGIDKDEQDYQYHKTKRDEAIEIKNDLESDDPERCRNALERLENLESNQRVLITENSLTSETEIGHNQKNQILRQMELTSEDLSYDGFSFSFPPLQADFNRSVIDSDKDLVNKELEKPELKTIQPGSFKR